MTIEAPSATAWEIDPVHSTVEFRVKHLGIATFRGQFVEISGSATFDEQDLANASVRAVIPTKALHVAGEKFIGHLLTPDFLDAEAYPEMVFESRKVEVLDGQRFRLIGDLTIRGTSKEVVFEGAYEGRAKHPFAPREHAAFSASTTIKRSDYGMVWNAPLDTGASYVGEKVTISLEIELARNVA